MGDRPTTEPPEGGTECGGPLEGEPVETQDPRGLGVEPRLQKEALVSELPFGATLRFLAL